MELPSVNNCFCCESCVQACRNDAISLIRGRAGFFYPVVQNKKCTHCGFCVDVCPVTHNLPTQVSKQVFAFQLNEESPALIESTAGGLFYALASEFILNRKGYVFGCRLDDRLQSRHFCAESMDQIKLMHGSKYIHSKIGDCFIKIKEKLEDNKDVLFVGLPCQVAGLKCYLSRDYDNLLTLDLICSGVPSQVLFDDFIHSKEKEFGLNVNDYRFRDKHDYGWSHTTVIRAKSADGVDCSYVIPDNRKVSYYNAFSSKMFSMDACYHCVYTSPERVSDITTGNFWGIDNISNEYNSRLGVSCVLLNTERGIQVFEVIKESGKFQEFTFDQVARCNHALVSNAGSVVNFKRRERLLKVWEEKGWWSLEKQLQYDWRYYLRNWRYCIKALLRRAKKVLKAV